MASQFAAYPAVGAWDEHLYVVTFPDIPDAHTYDTTEAAAWKDAHDCLIATFGGYIKTKKEIPPASAPTPNQRSVHIPPLVVAKLMLYQEFRISGITQVELAKRLNVRETVVRRMLDLDHDSKIDRINDALVALGLRLELGVEKAA